MSKECLEWKNEKYLYNRYVAHTPSETARKMYYYVQNAGHHVCQKDYSLWRKEFKSILVLITINGRGLLEYRGKQYELLKDRFFILDCYDYQEYHTYDSELWEYKWLHFFGDMSLEYFNQIFENHEPVMNIANDSPIEKCIDQIILMHEKGDPHFEIKASPIIHQILSSALLAAMTDADTPKITEYHNYIKVTRKYIEDNYQSNISVENIAASANLSRCYFSSLFKRFTGFNPHEYLVKYRINKAKMLLGSTDLSIEEIAGKTGFFEARSFIRTFKKCESITPLKYRNYFSNRIKKPNSV